MIHLSADYGACEAVCFSCSYCEHANPQQHNSVVRIYCFDVWKRSWTSWSCGNPEANCLLPAFSEILSVWVGFLWLVGGFFG